ncbi:MAG: RES family NAD+ phosphorylase [Mycobacteriales bacterium]
MVISVESLPRKRPDGLRLASINAVWWRLDARPPSSWTWDGFARPRNRFDAPGVRVRYAARTERGAFREHFADDHREISAWHASVSVVRLASRIRVLDLRSEPTLDALELDAEISTGRDERVFRTCWMLSERLQEWYGPRLHGIVYTSRTTPQTSANLAFFRQAPLTVTAIGRLDTRESMLADLIADDGFRVDLPGWV